MANTLPTTMEYFDNLLGEQLTDGGGGGGSSDFSTAEVTVNANTQQFEFLVPLINEKFGYLGAYDNINPSESETLTVCLYKGKALTQFLTDGVVSVSGNAQLNNNQILITGDCTITISAGQ